MGDFPRLWMPTSEIISSCGPEGCGPQLAAYSFMNGTSSSNLSSTLWPSANRALYVPLRITEPKTILKFWMINGSTAAINFDIGLYSPDGTKLSSTGSTAQNGTANSLQVVDVTDFKVGPGVYYAAFVLDATSGGGVTRIAPSQMTAAQQSIMTALGCYEQATAFPLPATATYANVATFQQGIPIFGLSCRATV